MKKNDVARLLAIMASFDQRTVGESDILAWYSAVGTLHYPAAQAAVIEHYRTSADRIRPVHVLDIARRAANDHVERASVSRDYRQNREDQRDERLAELCGGTRAARELTAAPSTNRPPASAEIRSRLMSECRAKFGTAETPQEKAARMHREWQAEQRGAPETVP
ncbi:hypothetical protein [Nocardia sp. NPDC004415]